MIDAKSNAPVKLRAVYNFYPSDPDFKGEYSRLELFGEDTHLIADFGDAYHNCADHKLRAFVKGVAWALQTEVVVEYDKQIDPGVVQPEQEIADNA
jgi:hypothetical protein